MSPTAVLSTLGLLKWPLTITGAMLFFGLSTEGTLSLVASNADKLTRPVAAKPSFNVPPVQQIGEIKRIVVAPKAPRNDGGTAGLSPSHTVEVGLRDTNVLQASPDPALTADGAAKIGKSAVNVRAAPAKGSAKLGVLAAGTAVKVTETSGGWVRVWYEGGSGWVYSTYLDRSSKSPVSITVSGGTVVEETREEPKQVEGGELVKAGSRIVVRSAPKSSAESLFRLERGERVKVVSRKGSWVQIATATGEGGWIRVR